MMLPDKTMLQDADGATKELAMNTAQLLNEREAAWFLNCSVAFLRRCRLFRTGPVYVKLGRLVRYRLEDVQAYIAANLEGSAA